jgi:SAM-dependent methyltransferase
MPGALIRTLTRFFARFEVARALLVRYYDRRSGVTRKHPIDIQYGIQTSSEIPGYALSSDSRETTGYIGSQPSIIRFALARIDQPERTILVDLGCGMGRVLAVGSEFPFREVIGVEISATLAAMAQANVDIVSHNFPDRSPIRVVTGDAFTFPLPDAPLALFLYRPFGKEGTRRLLDHIETALPNRSKPLTIVYYNPVWGAVFDASPSLKRSHALTIPYAAAEIGFGPDECDSVVIWTDRRFHDDVVSADAAREIIVTTDEWRAELAPLTGI